MLYFLAILLPPAAVLFAGGRPMQALLNTGLTLLGWIPGVIHAFLVVGEHKADKRADRMFEKQQEAQLKADEARARAELKRAEAEEKRARKAGN